MLWPNLLKAPALPANEPILTKLSEPTYPRLAEAAHIEGYVDVILTIRRDGTVESAQVVAGHAMLKQAALESAQHSQFDCGSCIEAATRYALKYKFQIVSRGLPGDCDYSEKQSPAETDTLHHEILVKGWAMAICDPAADIRRVRSAKCLYLWRCGTRDED
jgi:TonB family protein